MNFIQTLFLIIMNFINLIIILLADEFYSDLVYNINTRFV